MRATVRGGPINYHVTSHAHFLIRHNEFEMTSNSSSESLLLLPSAKRKKVEDGGMQLPSRMSQSASTQLNSIQEGHIKSEFPLRNLEDFYKTCPTYRLPVEVGSFSLDNKGKQQLDRTQLKYFSPPAPTSSRLNFDLKLGYDRYVPSKQNVPSDKLNPILRWIANNGDCFRPKQFSPKSPEKSEVPGGGVGGAPGVERRVSVGEVVGMVPTSKER